MAFLDLRAGSLKEKMVCTEKERWVKSDKDKEHGDVGSGGAKDAGDNDKGKKQPVLEEEGESKLPAGGLSGDKHGHQSQQEGSSRKGQPPERILPPPNKGRWRKLHNQVDEHDAGQGNLNRENGQEPKDILRDNISLDDPESQHTDCQQSGHRL